MLKLLSLPPFLIFREGDKLVPSVQKKINELEVGLLHLQQNIDIPEISLVIHPTIQGVVESKMKPVVEDLGAAVSDSTFLNALQKDVSRWIREIQKVKRVIHVLDWVADIRSVRVVCFIAVES